MGRWEILGRNWGVGGGGGRGGAKNGGIDFVMGG